MSRFYNRTRQSASIPRTLVRRRRFDLLPLYYLLSITHLGQEAIANSGSYEFADHIYGNRPKGKYLVGSLADAAFLNLPSARALRTRYSSARSALSELVHEARRAPRSLDVLAVSCGLARELFDTAREVEKLAPVDGFSVHLAGVDLDDRLVARLNHARGPSERLLEFWQGDALLQESYRDKRYDMIISLGFTEFLDDATTVQFYRRVSEHLRVDGRFLTSAIARHRLSDYVLRNVVELHATYRTQDDVRRLAKEAGFRRIDTYRPHRLQTILVAGNS